MAETPVPSAFTRKPSMSERFMQSFEQSEAGEARRQALGNQDIPPQRQSAPVMPQAEELPTTYQEPAPAQPMEHFAPVQPTDQPPVQPQPSDYERQVNQRLLAERNALLQQIQERDARLQQYAQRDAEMAASSQADAITKAAYDAPELKELEMTDPDDARRVISAVSSAVGRQMEAQRRAAAQQTASEVARQYQYQTAMEQARRRRDAVLAQHPDFYDLYKRPDFIQFLNGKDGYSSRTRDEVATQELQAGNTAYVIDLVNRYKRSAPHAGQVASVAPVQFAGSTSPYPQRSGGAAPDYTVGDLNTMIQLGQINQDEYRARLKRLREYNAARA